MPNTRRSGLSPDKRALLDLWLKGERISAPLSQLMDRHETLRTTFASHDGLPYQRVHPPAPVELPYVDVTDHPDPRTESERLVTEQDRRPFDLENGPLLR